MKDILIPLAIFIAISATGAFIAWCGGFNFDARNQDVACALTMIISFSALGSSIYFITK